jgi:hypothetical protein
VPVRAIPEPILVQSKRTLSIHRGAGSPMVLVFALKQYTKFREPVPISYNL